jgi:hypothetical protein
MNFTVSTKFYTPENTANRPMSGFEEKPASKKNRRNKKWKPPP